MSSFIPLSVPNIGAQEIAYTQEAVQAGWVSTAGSFVDRLEEDLAKYVGAPAATACQSGTAGLHLALLLAGVKPGDAVIVPTLTFIAAVNPVRYEKASPIFMDCGPDLCMDLNKLESYLKTCLKEGGQLLDPDSKQVIKALVYVHVFGNLAPMDRLQDLCRQYGLFLIEDATEALGSYRIQGGQKCFAGTFGDIGVYSFNGNKIITTGGGGMMVSRNKDFMAKAKYLSTQAKDNPVDYIHHEVGFNYRMTNLQAALGVAQLERLEDFIQTKIDNHELYKKLITVPGLRILPFYEDARNNRWFYSLVIDEAYPLDRLGLFEYLNENKVQTRPIWGLIHEQAPYVNEKAYEVDLAPKLQAKILNIPCSTNLSPEEVSRVCDLLNRGGHHAG